MEKASLHNFITFVVTLRKYTEENWFKIYIADIRSFYLIWVTWQNNCLNSNLEHISLKFNTYFIQL